MNGKLDWIITDKAEIRTWLKAHVDTNVTVYRSAMSYIVGQLESGYQVSGRECLGGQMRQYWKFSSDDVQYISVEGIFI